MRKLIYSIFLFITLTTFSQSNNTTKVEDWKSLYRSTSAKINDLVHTKLDVKFNYNKAYMYGKAWITLHPHFYPTDSLNLDAKGMNINEVSVVKAGKNIQLRYSYDSINLKIKLDKSYKANENYTVFINYVSKPNERTNQGNAVLGSKGLYFINPQNTEKDIPVQIYTQGESEFNSVWFPTIDKPNQKTTEEISMTVLAKYVTLSNGLMVSQKKNKDGTRTDTWKMDLPHAPYLFFMGVGEYAVVKDNYKGKEVNYYVEKDYASVARKIFGLTPEMIAFFSKITGVDYPWPKYAQITGREYGGAMENTSSTLHSNAVQQDARELVDENKWEDIVAHELFHQWFGDLVTCESWSNITLNESFADYSEMLWREYKYGKDEGQAVNNRALRTYLSNPEDTAKSLVRFSYNDKEDVFDNVSYPKGGRTLNMLRNYVGDSAFFKSIQLYLKANKYKSAEAHNLRLAFEEITGQDLNWFWNQWYYGSGHPKLDISYDYNTLNKTAKVFISQTKSDKVFKLPFAIDVYEGSNKKRYKVWMDRPTDTFSFEVNKKPDLINVDADKVLICEKIDHKTTENFIYQYKNAASYTDRREAIENAVKNQTNPAELNFLKTALSDKSPRLRVFTLNQLDFDNDTVQRFMETTVMNMATNDETLWVKADAIKALGNYKKNEFKSFFIKALLDSSYSVAGNALDALGKTDSNAALQQATTLSRQPAKGPLMYALTRYADVSKFDSLAAKFDKLPIDNSKFSMAESFGDFLNRVKNTDNVTKGVDIIVAFRNSIPEQYRSNTDPFINNILSKLAESKQAGGLKEQAKYIKSKLPKINK